MNTIRRIAAPLLLFTATATGAAACTSQTNNPPTAAVGAPSTVTVPAPAPATTSPPGTPAPSTPERATVTVTAQAPAVTPTVTRSAPPPAPAPVTTPFTNAGAVVQQYYQDLNDHQYRAAWDLGGKYIGGSDYASWVAGYSTTASVSLGTVNDFGSGRVDAVLYATQTDGSVKVYSGSYTVSNGVIVGANIRQQ